MDPMELCVIFGVKTKYYIDYKYVILFIIGK